MLNNYIVLYANENLKVNRLLNSDFSKENYDSSSSTQKMLHLPTIMQTLDSNIESSKPNHMLDHTNVSLTQSQTAIAPTSYQNIIAQNNIGFNSFHAKSNYENPYTTSSVYYPTANYQTQYQNQNGLIDSKYDANKLSHQQSSTSYFTNFPTTTVNSKYNLENLTNSHLDYGLTVSPSASMPYLFSHIDSQVNTNDHQQHHDTHHQLLHHQTIQELNSLTNLNTQNKEQPSPYQGTVTPMFSNSCQRQEGKSDHLQSETFQLKPNINSESSSSSTSTSSLSSSSSINDGVQTNQNDNNSLGDDLALSESNAQSSKPPVIYAWMKKVHMNNGSEYKFIYLY
jgi:hypothetical protein